jgi:uncharacterized protein YjbI with pentapeptide repeats
MESTAGAKVSIPRNTPRCREHDCEGVALKGFTQCLGHLPAGEIAGGVLNEGIDGRLAPLSAERLQIVLEAFPEEHGRVKVPVEARFDGAVFTDRLDLEQIEFERTVVFEGATFQADAAFIGCVFAGLAQFQRTTFEAGAAFMECGFRSGAHFEQADFQDSVRMDSSFAGFTAEAAKFSGWTQFLFFHSSERAVFAEARFEGPVTFAGAEITNELNLESASFKSRVDLKGLRSENFTATGAVLERGGDLGGISVDKLVDFREAVFEQNVRLRIRSDKLDLRRAFFASGASVEVEAAFVALSGASFRLASTLSATQLGQTDRLEAIESKDPRLGKLEGADIGQLSLEGFDLSTTQFTGAHGLGGLRMVDVNGLPQSPVRPWTRVTVYDEHRVRAGERGWSTAEAPPEPEPLNIPNPVMGRGAPTPKEVADAYRSLRRGREDAKDAPGASDFYVGEMEMRRKAETGPLLWAYWVVSGYGTRARRSFLFYGMLVAFGAVVMSGWGVGPELGLWRSATYALSSTVYIANLPTGHELTGSGELMQFLLRTLGPLFLGLSLLALRTRVKR